MTALVAGEDATTSVAGEERGTTLQWWMLGGFIGGLTLGLIVYTFSHGSGQDANWVGWIISHVTGPIGQIFLRLLFMLVIPLLVSALIVGVADMREMATLKSVGIRTLVYTVTVSAIAVVISLALVNLIQPGAGVSHEVAAQMLAQSGDSAKAITASATEAKTGMDQFIAIVPSNFIRAMSENDVLAVMFFALLFGIGFLLTPEEKTRPLHAALEGVFEIAMKLIGLVIKMAPLAIFCFMFNLAAQFGWDLLIRLSGYVAVVLLALGVQMFGIFPLILATLGKKNPLAFFREVREPMVMAFATASSNATLPTSLVAARDKLHLPDTVARFVLTIGATANQNGSAMFEGVTVLFLAQFFGVHLDLGQQVVVMLICILGGIGTAGVPAGTLPVIALILGSMGVPPEGIGLVLGVDRFLDMCRTTVNVIGDLVAAQVVSTTSARALAHQPALTSG